MDAQPYTMIKYTVDGKEIMESVTLLNLHKEKENIVKAIDESGKKANILIDNCTVENLKKAFALNPKILHIGGHGVYDFQPRFHKK
jgi:hypothetical protein